MSAGSDATFRGTIGKTIADSKPWWPAAGQPPKDAPNILVVLFDDVGFSDFGCYGSRISTPTIDGLAAEGLCVAAHGFLPAVVRGHVCPRLASPPSKERACLKS